VHVRGLRRLGIADRAAMTFELSDTVRRIVGCGGDLLYVGGFVGKQLSWASATN